MTYTHSWIVQVTCWISMASWGSAGIWLLLASGNEGMRWPGWFGVAVATLTAWLYWRSGCLQWRIENSGLSVRRPLGVQFVPWSEVRSIVWLASLRTIQIKGATGVICFMSADGFPQLRELVAEVARRTSCEIPKGLREALRIA